MKSFDSVIRGGTLVIPKVGVLRADIGVSDGKIAEIGEIAANSAKKTINATGKFIFPGALDTHFHIGIHRPFKDDATSESSSAVSGGVTTILTFFRTGKGYLNKVGPYSEILPELMELSRNAFITDYGYHLAIMTKTQLDEIDWLISEAGVAQFKYYMFYKSLDLSGSGKAADYLMIEEPQDLGLLYEIMDRVAKANLKNHIKARVAVHCEDPEVIRVTSERVKQHLTGNSTKDYSDSRPGFQEGLAIHEAGYLAWKTGCPITLVHLSSREAVDAARDLTMLYPDLDIVKEATLHHLALSNDKDYGNGAKVNPPIRDPQDVEYLWNAVLDGDIDNVVSDHASILQKNKQGDFWSVIAGFGGTALMFPVLITEGYFKRGLRLERVAEMTSLNPALHHGLYPKKGSIIPGGDADLAIIDLGKEQEVSTDILHSAQDYTPFEGLRFKGWPVCTMIRGEVVYERGKILGRPGYGKYLKR
ncbi:dihydroorotase family protein [Chloroflexota bacterium]